MAHPAAGRSHDSELSNLLVETEQARTGLVIRSEGRRSPCVGINGFGSFDDYFAASVKKHYRTKLRRDLKRLDETGQDWGVEYFETPEEIVRGLEGLLQVRRASWKGAPSQGFVRFFQEISPCLADRRDAHHPARVAGRPVAVQYLVCKDGEYCMILNDHDHQYHATVAPGNKLLTLVLQEAFNATGESSISPGPTTNTKNVWPPPRGCITRSKYSTPG